MEAVEQVPEQRAKDWRELKDVIREERSTTIRQRAARESKWLGPTTWVVPAVGRTFPIARSDKFSPARLELSGFELIVAVKLGIYSESEISEQLQATEREPSRSEELDAQFSLLNKLQKAAALH